METSTKDKRDSGTVFSETKLLRQHIFSGFVFRVLLVIYSGFHDARFELKYTDIDYVVYTDAANHVVKGGSPYDRDAYRYTPLLAIVLTPNLLLHEAFGKMLFTVFDVAICWLIYRLVHMTTRDPKLSFRSTLLWLYNPLPIGICTRGSSESLIVLLVLSTLYLLRSGRYVEAGIIHGVAVHFRIYPLIYSPLLFFALGNGAFKISRRQIQFVGASVLTFSLVTGLCYSLYGWKFLEETYFYHVYRQDFKHNFSIFWYFFYLNGDSSALLGYLPFVTQLICVVVLTAMYSSMERIEFGIFAIIFSFITFNKVVTSQYFLWYLSLLPLIWFRLDISWKTGAIMAVLWYAAQGAFLLPAYLLEFRDMEVHIWVFLGCLSFFVCNCAILLSFVRSFDHQNELKGKVK